MDPQGFQQVLNSYAPQQQQPTPSSVYSASQQPTPQPQTPEKGNWLTHLLPTIGGAIGGIGAGLLSGGLGGVAGGAGGAAVGKAIENKLEGQAGGNGVLGQAALGGIGEGVGGVIGKIGGRVLGSIGDKSGQLADNLVKGQFAKNTISGDSASALRGLGLTDARQIPQVANIVTGKSGVLNQGVINGLKTSDTPADLSGLSKTAQNLVSENQMQLNGNSIPEINKTIQGALIKSVNPTDVTQTGIRGAGNKVVNSFEPGALTNTLPERAYDVAKNFESLANSAYNSAYDKMGNVINPDQLAKYKIFSGLADHANGAAFGGNTPLPLTDEVKSQIIDNLGSLKGINPTVHTNLVKQISNANSLQDLRGIQAPFVQGSKAVDATARVADRGAGATANSAMNNLTIPGAIVGGPHGMLAGLGAQALRSPTADRAAIPFVQNGGAILSKIGNSQAPGLLGGAAGVGLATSNNLIQPSNGTMGDTMPPDTTMMSQPGMSQTAPGGLSRDDLITLALYSPGSLASLTPNAQQVQNTTNAQSAENALTGLGNAPEGGILSGLQGKLGLGATGEYQRKAASAAEQVAQAIPGTDKAAIEKQLTDYAAGGGNINEAVKSLLTRLQSVVQSNQNTGLSGILGVNAGSQPQTVTSQLPVMQ